MKRTYMLALKYTENDQIQAQKSHFKHFDSDKAKSYRRNLALELKESLTDEHNFVIFTSNQVLKLDDYELKRNN